MKKLDLDSAIQRAISTSAISKVLTLLVQVLALPLALHSVGSELFGVYVMVTGLLSWLSLSSSGLFPGLTREVARHHEDFSRIKQLFFHALIIVLITSIAISVIGFIILYTIPIELLFGPFIRPFSSEAKLAAITALICVLFQVIGGTAEAVRTGMQQQHINNLWGVFGNLLSIPLLFTCANLVPEIFFLVIATHGALSTSKILNLIHLLHLVNKEKSQLIKFIDKSIFKILIGTGLILLIGQIATLMTQQGSAYIVGYISGPKPVADFSVMLRITVIAGGIVVMVSQPLAAAITSSVTMNNKEWIYTNGKKLGILTLAYAFIAGFIIMLAGKSIVKLWLGNEVSPKIELFFLTGLYFIVVVWNHLNYVTLIALGETLFPTLVLLSESVLMIILAVILTPRWGASGAMFALLVSGILVSGIANYKRLRHRLDLL